jgi:hypothetical protein
MILFMKMTSLLSLMKAQASAENFINRSITERNFVMQCDKFETVTFERNYENDVISKIEYYALVKLL